MSGIDNEKVLKYSKLFFKHRTLKSLHMEGTMPPEELMDIAEIPEELGMKHEAILNLASELKKSLSGNGC
jgi:hypothetical protein